jgi:hypothetical protein
MPWKEYTTSTLTVSYSKEAWPAWHGDRQHFIRVDVDSGQRRWAGISSRTIYYKLGCPSRDCGCTCGPSLSLEQGIHFGNHTGSAPGRGGFLRTSVDKALFLRCYMGFGHTSHFFFLRLRMAPLSNGFLQQHAFLGISWIVPAYNAE